MKIEELPEILTEDVVFDIIMNLSDSERLVLTRSLTTSQREDYDRIYHKLVKDDFSNRAEWSIYRWLVYSRQTASMIARNTSYSSDYALLTKVKKRVDSIKDEKFTFFWETASPFSQWHPSSFTAPSHWQSEFQEHLMKVGIPKHLKFCSAEQYMMYWKAMIFGDLVAAKGIMSETNPRKIKAIGRQVRGFDKEAWECVFRFKIVCDGNKLKFEQNEHLREALFATQGTTLVEAAPNDKIWGIGLAKDNPKAHQRATWEGENLLGEILTDLRVQMMGHY